MRKVHTIWIPPADFDHLKKQRRELSDLTSKQYIIIAGSICAVFALLALKVKVFFFIAISATILILLFYNNSKREKLQTILSERCKGDPRLSKELDVDLKSADFSEGSG